MVATLLVAASPAADGASLSDQWAASWSGTRSFMTNSPDPGSSFTYLQTVNASAPFQPSQQADNVVLEGTISWTISQTRVTSFSDGCTKTETLEASGSGTTLLSLDLGETTAGSGYATYPGNADGHGVWTIDWEGPEDACPVDSEFDSPVSGGGTVATDTLDDDLANLPAISGSWSSPDGEWSTSWTFVSDGCDPATGPDSDGDGFTDCDETLEGTDPLDETDFPGSGGGGGGSDDADGDGIPDADDPCPDTPGPVTGCPEPPIPAPDILTGPADCGWFAFNVLENDIDPNGDDLSLLFVIGSGAGLTWSPDGTVELFMTPGPGVFAGTYRVTDAHFTADMTWMVSAVNCAISDIFPLSSPVTAGGDVRVSGSGFAPGTTVDLGMTSEPVYLGSDTSAVSVSSGEREWLVSPGVGLVVEGAVAQGPVELPDELVAQGP